MYGSAPTEKGFHHRTEDYNEYEEDYDEYEEEASYGEEEAETPKPIKEEQDFLKLREELKERMRKKLQKQNDSAFGHFSQNQERKRTTTNGTFGSFFGPSKPVIASRVIEESKSIREIKHIMENMSSCVAKKRDATAATILNHQQRKPSPVVTEIKKKAQTLKDMRDYSFLFSDDSDLPTSKEQTTSSSFHTPKSDGHSSLTSQKRKLPMANYARLSTISKGLKNTDSRHQQMPSMTGSGKKALPNRSRPVSVESRKVLSGSAGNASSKSVGPNTLLQKGSATGNASGKPVGTNTLHQKGPAQIASHNSKPSSELLNPWKANLSSAQPHASAQKHHQEQKRPSQGPDHLKKAMKQRMPPSKYQPAMQKSHGNLDDHSKRKPLGRTLSDEEDVDYRSLIRGIFRYNPDKYAGIDEDDSDMEVGFDMIQNEERVSSKIARKEDEEQLRLIQEEEERERQMRRMKKKLKHG